MEKNKLDIIFNLSIKKSGTTFLHTLFRHNHAHIHQFFVSPIQEIYFCPRPTKNCLGLSEKALRLLKSGLDQRGQTNLCAQDKEFLEALVLQDIRNGFRWGGGEGGGGKGVDFSKMMERFISMFHVASEATILMSDNSLSLDLVDDKYLAKAFGNAFAERGRGIHAFMVARDPITNLNSYLEMTGQLNNWAQMSHQDRIRLAQRNDTFWVCKRLFDILGPRLQKFIIYDFDHVTRERDFLPMFCSHFQLSLLDRIDAKIGPVNVRKHTSHKWEHQLVSEASSVKLYKQLREEKFIEVNPPLLSQYPDVPYDVDFTE